jgi:RNA polymerase-binding transcription factor DksA
VTATPTPDGATGDVADLTPDPTSRAEVRDVAARLGVTPAELIKTLRDVARALAVDPSLCDWCDGPIPEDRLRAGARYCSENHRKEASRRRTSRRRMFAEHAETGATSGSCDLCGASCHIENAVCDACFDALADQERDARDASPNDVDPGA